MSEEKSSELKWYIVNTYSSFEARAKASLEERIKNCDFPEKFGEVLLPVEVVVSTKKGGEKKTSTRKYFPGYILVQMEMCPETWHLVKSTPKVSGFVGNGTDPVAMPQSEVDRILGNMNTPVEKVDKNVVIDVGNTVRVLDGPFKNFTATVESVDKEEGHLCISVNILGRVVPFNLDFSQVEKC